MSSSVFSVSITGPKSNLGSACDEVIRTARMLGNPDDIYLRIEHMDEHGRIRVSAIGRRP